MVVALSKLKIESSIPMEQQVNEPSLLSFDENISFVSGALERSFCDILDL